MADAFALEGVKANDGISTITTVGDINGDGFTDYLVSGIATANSYLLLGPVKPNSLYRVDTDESFDPETAPPDLHVHGNDWSYEVTINSQQELKSLAKYYRLEGRSEVIVDAGVFGKPARSMGSILSVASHTARTSTTWCS